MGVLPGAAYQSLADEHWTSLFVSQGILELTGYPPEAFTSRRLDYNDLILQEDRSSTRETIAAALRDRRTYEAEHRIRHRDGSVRWIWGRGHGVFAPDGTLRWIEGWILDITPRRQAEETLRESEERFRGTFENAAVGIAHCDPQGRFLRVNQKQCDILQYTRQELLALRFQDVTHPDDLSLSVAQFERLLRGEVESYSIEVRHVCKDGSVKWTLVTASAQRDPILGLLHSIGVVEDISERKRLEEELQESEERFRFLANVMPHIVWRARADGTSEYLNDRFKEYTGLTVDDLTAEVWLSLFHPDDRETTSSSWLAAVAKGVEHDFEFRFRAADGSYRWFKSHGLPVRDESGQITKWVGTTTDIDKQKRAEIALERAKKEAEAANRAKDEFLANVSHEIRTPMNAILGMTELALDTPLTGDQNLYLTTVKSAADALLGIINDILDFAKIEAGRMELDRSGFSLASVLGTTLRALAVRAHKKGLELICQQNSDVPDALVGDAGRLRQVLLNLVGNAIKFTERGEIVVLVENAEEQPPDGEVRLSFAISDTGIGIPLEDQTRIFRAFEQEDASITRKYGGTGLGLTIAARLVTLMDGHFLVDSRPGWGSKFTFTARFGIQPHPPEAASTPRAILLHGLRVLIVDDSSTNRRILEEWLRGYAMDPTSVGDGAAALAALRHGVAIGRPYSLGLLDGRMPDIDGLDLAAEIRQQAELSETRLILMTSEERPGDATRARHIEIYVKLLKPIQSVELIEAIFRVMGHRSDESYLPSVAGRLAAMAPSHLPPRILVAEDNEFNRDLLEHMLSRLGLSAVMAENGEEALSLLEREPVDLLLLDLHMPKLDGFQVIRAIRDREREVGGHLPVVALTARYRIEVREQCLRAGMDDYLSKPFTAADLAEAIERLIGTSPTQSPTGQPLIDPSVLLAACGGDAVMLEKMCRILRARGPEQLAAIRDALHDQDAVRLRQAAHKFNGMVSAFSTVAGNQAAALEDLAVQGMLEEAIPFIEQLERNTTELARLSQELTVEALRKGAARLNRDSREEAPEVGEGGV
ncbi:PAS domain-containing hybrid sensor histidine kinase/response regulator [Aquisphaera insulae]|uniref:PAS domain-containing hybrid sensor histidine kinase/response regulator n=1 Tax=Aquisphaera insulae TaxID=2712864 RepID=UPI0013EB263B|nr:PAS domain-containing hybrid sensor histidine kinase/response regulator [Aquisphaera insulae]